MARNRGFGVIDLIKAVFLTGGKDTGRPSTLKTVTLILSICVFMLMVTVLPQSMKGKPQSVNLLNLMADHSLVVLDELVDMDTDFTLFAPTAKALEKQLVKATQTDMTDFFEGHIVYERVISSGIPKEGKLFETAKGTTLSVELKDGTLFVQGMPVLYDDVTVGARGVVHIIEGVLDNREKLRENKSVKEKARAGKASATQGERSKRTAHRRQVTPKTNPFDAPNPNKQKNLNLCSGHGYVDDKDVCHCASLYEGQDCSKVRKAPFKRIVGYSPIVFNKNIFPKMDEIMVRTKAKILSMMPKVTPAGRKSIMEVLPEDDPFHGRVFNTCSLIGSSGSLLYFENGPVIDQSDLVIRFNHAPITMFEKYVGSRTDLRISNGEHLGFNERPNEHTLHHLRSRSFFIRIMMYEKTFGKKKLPYLVNPGFTEYVANASVPYIASSGYFAILMAMEVCSNVHLYGFHSSFNQGSRHHYFNAEVPSNPKRDTSEYERLKKLEDHGFLKFAEPCLHECYGSSSDCEACFGMPMYKVTARQKLTAKQLQMAKDLEKERLKFRQWESKPKREWEWKDDKGLVKKTGRGRVRRRGGRGEPSRRGGRRSRRGSG